MKKFGCVKKYICHYCGLKNYEVRYEGQKTLRAWACPNCKEVNIIVEDKYYAK